MSLEMWAVAAVAIVDAAGNPLILRTYTSPRHVLESPEAPQQAHLYVGPEDIVKIHFLLFSSLDRCEELWHASRQRFRAAAAAKQASTTGTSSTTTSSTAAGEVAAGAAAAGGGNAAGDSSTSGSISAAARVTSSPRTGANAAVSGGRASVVSGNTVAGAPSTNRSALQGTPVSVPMLTTTAAAAAATSSTAPKPRLVTSTTDVRFMGKLSHGHRFLSYGLCSATGVKTVLVTVGCDAPQDAVLPLCRAIYEAASAALCNPFRTPDVSWRAQQALLERGYQDLLNYWEAKLNREQAAAAAAAASSGDAGRAAYYKDLVAGMQEHSWPRSAPTPYRAAHQPTLAVSEAFNRQLQSILSTLTVTSQSCIMH